MAFSVAILWAAWSMGPQTEGLRAIDIEGGARIGPRADLRPLTTDETVALPVRLEVPRESTARVALSRGAQLRIAGGSAVRIEPDGARVERGSLMHDVAPGRGPYVVELGRFDVVVLGTVFWTARQGREASVCLLEGSVLVRGGGETLARLAPGEGWRSSERAPDFPDDLPCGGPAPDRIATVPARASPSPDGAAGSGLAPGQIDEAPAAPGPAGRPGEPGDAGGRVGANADVAPVDEEHPDGGTAQAVPAGVEPAPSNAPGLTSSEAGAPAITEDPAAAAPGTADRDPCARAPRGDRESCYRDAAARPSLRAQNAQFRLGELQLARGAASEALETWREYRRRYPGGLYVEEADLGMLEARLRLGSGDVLGATAEFLQRHPATARASEVRVIRGVLLHRRGQYREALSEYERALSGVLSAGRRADAEYGTAACLEAIGRIDDAASAYRRLLERHPSSRTSPRAREALDRLERPDGGARRTPDPADADRPTGRGVQ